MQRLEPEVTPPEPPAPQKTGPEVPPRKLLAIKAAFSAIDTNNTGSISASELKVLLDKVGKDDLTDKDREAILKSMDKDQGGEIELSEFVQWVMSQEGANDAIANWSLAKGLGELHEAAIRGDGAKIKTLIDAGQKVNAGDINNVTPLHYACRTGNFEAATALVEKKADLTARTSDTKRMPIHAAAENGSADVLQLLISVKAEVNAQDGKQRTPLHWACCSSREAAADILLKAGADVHVKSIAGYTAFAMAQDWSTTSMADLIAQHGGGRF